MIRNTPPERPDAPGVHGTYAQGDFVESAQRSRLHKDQYYAGKGPFAAELPDAYGEIGFPGDVPSGTRQSGYGEDFGQLEGAQVNETHVSEQDIRKAGTAPKSDR